jgi:predicted O-methyltransferase YrrM
VAKRYSQLIDLAAKLKPKHIIEVGVHRGIRAAKMCQAAGASRYTGFDVFDTLPVSFQDEALNGKGMVDATDARRRLDALVARGGFKYDLVIGDTRETLHPHARVADLAFIDGDHRVEAIAGDYAALADCPVVVFDDYYREDGSGAMPDLDRYGANRTVDELAAAGLAVEILPLGDVCAHGGLAHLAVVRR